MKELVLKEKKAEASGSSFFKWANEKRLYFWMYWQVWFFESHLPVFIFIRLFTNQLLFRIKKKIVI